RRINRHDIIRKVALSNRRRTVRRDSRVKLIRCFIDTLKKISQKHRKFQWSINNSKKIKIL
ncbi:hypothetical protein FWK35_00004285, partial [Aphis craccivora]